MRRNVPDVHRIFGHALRRSLRIAVIFIMFAHGCSNGPFALDGVDSTGIPARKTWEADLLEFGKLQCGYFKHGEQENYSTYYDAARVFYQTARYFGKPDYNGTPWTSCADVAVKLYREKEIDWKGQYGYIAGWSAFSTGLRMHYEQTGDPRSKDAVHLLATHGWAADGGPTWGYPYMREIAYAIMNHLDDEALGTPHRSRLDELVGTALQHFDQMFVSKIALTKPYRGADNELAGITPFMVGLEAQALIQYYEKYKDARIPSMIKTAADVLYEEVTPLGMRIWDPKRGAFLYDTIWGGGRNYEPGLNLLVVPLYGWVYMMTGETKYRDRGDEIWREGVQRAHCASAGNLCGSGGNGSYLWFGKQFNQSYMWSFRYIDWRKAGDAKNQALSAPVTHSSLHVPSE
jgi:hypothetical protein